MFIYLWYAVAIVLPKDDLTMHSCDDHRKHNTMTTRHFDFMLETKACMNVFGKATIL